MAMHREMVAADLGDPQYDSILILPRMPRTEREIRERMVEIARRHKIAAEYELAPYIKLLTMFPTQPPLYARPRREWP